MRWLLMQLALCAVTCLGYRLNISLLMSSPDLINIPAKQSPVINRLHDCMTQAMAYAHAIRDNAQDDGVPIPMELVASFQADYNNIIAALNEAHNIAS
jgi:hypothetical protein